jgi:hypothetical protein
VPWTASDAKRFKKGLTSAQAAKWAKIANAALKSCQAKGGKNCEASAIKIANSKFIQQSEGPMKKDQELAKGALRFIDHGCHAHVELVEKDGKSVPKLNMVAYSGGVIKDHWYWNDLAIDLEGIQFKQSKFPVLEDHLNERKIAVIGKPIVEDGKLKAPENAKFLSTEASEEFQKLSQEGFPYQSSIYAKPSVVERLEEGATSKVNGMTIKGPASIWRKCEFKEMSVCVFGADSKTRASAFSREEMEYNSFSESTIPAESLSKENAPILKRREVKKIMNKEELKETYPDLLKEITAEAVSSAVSAAEKKFNAEKDELSTQVETLKESNEKLSGKVLVLEKKDVIRAESELKSQAQKIWNSKLTESTIPEHVWDKVSQHVSHIKFVSEGVLDVEKFSEAIDGEIKDWEGKGVTSSVLGTGFSQKEPEGENKQAQEAESVKADVDRLAKLAGVNVAEQQASSE